MCRVRILVLATFLCAGIGAMLGINPAMAVSDYWGCLDAVGGDRSNSAMQRACSESIGSPGAAWISSHSYYTTDQYAYTSNASGEITIYMYAALYNVGAGKYYAKNIQLCDNLATRSQNTSWNQCGENGSPSWVVGYSGSFLRGYSYGYGQWTRDGEHGKLKINVDRFKDGAEVTEYADRGYTEYRRTMKFARCPGKEGDTGCMSGGTYAWDDVTIYLRVDDPVKIGSTPSTNLSGMTYIGEKFSLGSAAFTKTDWAETNNPSTQRALDSGELVRQTGIKFYTDGDGSGLGATTISASDAAGARSEMCKKLDGQNCSEGSNNQSVDIVDDEAYVGKKLCIANATNVAHYVYNRDDNGNLQSKTIEWDSEWRVSGASCIPIAKKTSVGIAGNSVYANNGVRTTVARKSSGTAYGSWAEFLIATGTVGISGNTSNIGTSSGGGLYSGLSGSARQSDTAKWSPESIGNKSMSGQQSVPAAGISSSSSFRDRVKSQLINDKCDGVTIICTDHISSNIYNNETDLSKYKQKIIYSSGNLTIDNNVRRIDAWIIVDGNLDTCSNGTVTGKVDTSMDANTCNNQLIINGLVYANSITLDRTSGGTGADMAEIINLTPMSYVWAYNQASSTNANPTTVYIRELAPRM